jgi:hypothetical protein
MTGFLVAGRLNLFSFSNARQAGNICRRPSDLPGLKAARPAAPTYQVASMIRLQCPKCEKKLGVDDSKAGGVGVCPECGQKFRIPGKPPPSNKPNPNKGAAPRRQATAPAKQAAAKPAAPPSRPKEAWEEEDSSPYEVKGVEERGEDAVKVEYGIDKDYEKKVARKQKEDEKQEFRAFLGLMAIMIVIGIVLNCLWLIMPELIWAPIGIGFLIMITGTIMLLVQAFKQDVLSFLLMFFVPFYDIYFTVMHWQDARNAFALRWIGLIIYFAGFLLGGRLVLKDAMDQIEKQKQSLHGPIPVLVQEFAFHEPCGSGFQS